MEEDYFPFSQEATRQAVDLVFPTYNFGFEPQRHDDQNQAAVDAGQGPGPSGRIATGKDADNTKFMCRHKRTGNGKIFSDPIHGTFRLDPINVAVIDTPQFQRLRELHQLGLTHLVFPGAVHTRFEHSLGTSHKAFEMADRIYRTQGTELNMDKDDIRLVTLAGLCHDLGHGPFSHVFETEFLRRKHLMEPPGSGSRDALNNWHHETMSTMMLEYLVDDNYIEDITQDDIRRISAFIKGDADEDRGFLFDIVNNKRCGVDVDKIDYLQRDAKMCDVNIGCDFKRLLTLTKVVQDRVGFKWSEYSNIWDLFHARESMHRKVYTHRKTKAVEFMAVDALLEADQAMHFSEDIYRAEDFIHLDDSLLSHIEHFGKLGHRHRKGDPEPETDADSCLQRAQALIRRLRCRDLYRFGNQFTVPHDALGVRWESLSKEFTAANLANCYRGSDLKLVADDVIVSQTKIDYTAGSGNPLDNVLFWDHSDDREGRHITQHQVLGILPQYHQERILRVYTPRQDPKYQQAVGEALTAWCRRVFGSNVQMATPARPRPPAAASARETAMREADPRRRPPAVPSSATGTIGPTATAYRGVLTSAVATLASATTTTTVGGNASCGLARAASGGGEVGTAAAGAGSAAGASRIVGGNAAAGAGASQPDNDGGGTPTRSTPLGMGSVLSAAAAGLDGAGGADGSEARGTAGNRAKRPRSSGALFQD